MEQSTMKTFAGRLATIEIAERVMRRPFTKVAGVERRQRRQRRRAYGPREWERRLHWVSLSVLDGPHPTWTSAKLSFK